MARKDDSKKNVVIKKPQAQKVMVTRGRHPMFGEEIPMETLFQKKVESVEEAKELENQLKEEYKNQDAISVFHFGI